MGNRKWLVINYNLPTEPSRHRVAVWRGLKKSGAVNIQQSMWVLPDNEVNRSALQEMSREIESNNGECLLMECMFLDEQHEERVISLFNDIRNEEYTEFLSECKKYLNEIEKEISIEKFSFAELEEEEEELQKLISWYGKIGARDIFRSSLKNDAEKTLEQIKSAFEGYSELVYKYNDK